MRSRKETILKAAKRTAKQAHAAASRKVQKTRVSTSVDLHRHCSVCWKPIPLDSEPAICSSVECSNMFERREKSRRRFTFVMYVGIAIFVGLLGIQIFIGATS